MDTVDRATEFVFGEGSDRVCEDIPDDACARQPENLRRHVLSLTATKTGDGLVDPKLILSWLVVALGAPASAAGLVVPLREALALLPQLAVGHRIRSLEIRKYAWAGASVAQGLAVGAMGLVALLGDGAGAGWTIVGLVAVFAAARSVASVSYKDVLGKTVAKSRRGTVTGTATSAAAVVTLAFGLALALDVLPLETTWIGGVLLVAAGLWIVAGLVFAGLEEAPGSTEGGVDGVGAALRHLGLLRSDPQLRRFVVTRSLLTVTAVAPPYLVGLAAEDRGEIDTLGWFVVATGVATVVGGRLWGTLSDRSSRKVLIGAALASTVLFLAAAAVADGDGGGSSRWIAAGLLFLVTLAYQGVRLGRSTHLVDMAEGDQRPIFTAVSNTVVGVALLGTGAFGALEQAIGLRAVFATFAAFSIAAAWLGRGLDEVQQSESESEPATA